VTAVNWTRRFDGREFVKSSASGAGNDCVYLPASGILDAVADSKTGRVLPGDAAGLVAFARTTA